jgi:hypothetical protein
MPGPSAHIAIWRRSRPLVLDGTDPQRVEPSYISDSPSTACSQFSAGDSRQTICRKAPCPVVLLGYDFWQSRFGGDRGVIDRTIRLDTQPTTIVGVLPRGFYREVQIWRPPGRRRLRHARDRQFSLETRPIEPLTFALVALTLGAAAAFAAWIPARRAAQVDPVASLRAE